MERLLTRSLLVKGPGHVGLLKYFILHMSKGESIPHTNYCNSDKLLSSFDSSSLVLVRLYDPDLSLLSCSTPPNPLISPQSSLDHCIYPSTQSKKLPLSSPSSIPGVCYFNKNKSINRFINDAFNILTA